ncbi:hypothetical protein KBX37_30255 [Micromonospora sp. U56]|uniref:hypothetical protein n=1 Tax=Micromonospora sp. U56 TaxID=2824900 RepID=UPI001B38590C|nr:hypothetical protein [Micromonospora sp. U56]MBQ0897299.1 hypothetical protein [Micromonospora sp. U56]
MIEMGVVDPPPVARAALQNGATTAGLLPTTNTLVVEEQTPWDGSLAPMTQFGRLNEGLQQPVAGLQHAAVARAWAVGRVRHGRRNR